MTDPRHFYDRLAGAYHLIFEDWEQSIARQSAALARILERWLPQPGLVLDAAAGIGTQLLGFAAHGFRMVGSDISVEALHRASSEVASRELVASFVAADFRALPFRSGWADAVIACDNALPHLMSIAEIASAMREMARCVRPGGGVVISVRDYVPQPTGTQQTVPYGEREWEGRRYHVEQEWEWHGRFYNLRLRIRSLEGEPESVADVQTSYFAVSIPELLDVMRTVGLVDVQRLDGVYYQPLLIGTVSHAA
ncbi:MAG: class I SAM-dependent methyltransferase [Longimicrobiales bacterium]